MLSWIRPAHGYTLKELSLPVELVRQEKLPKEQPEEDFETEDITDPTAAVSDGISINGLIILLLIKVIHL